MAIKFKEDQAVLSYCVNNILFSFLFVCIFLSITEEPFGPLKINLNVNFEFLSENLVLFCLFFTGPG